MASRRQPSHRRGRPPLPAEHRRRHLLTLRLNDGERDRLLYRAQQAHLPAAAYAHRCALARGRPREVPRVNARSVGELGRLANNLNQLTKLAHQGQTSPALLPNLRVILVEVRAVRRMLIGLEPQGAGSAERRRRKVSWR